MPDFNQYLDQKGKGSKSTYSHFLTTITITLLLQDELKSQGGDLSRRTENNS